MIAMHAQVMCNNATPWPVVMAQTDLIARLTRNLYGGAKIVYDDKAQALEMQRYGMFWKAQKNFLIGLEYNKTGDRQSIDATFNHKINLSTQIGSTVSYDLNQKKLFTKTAIERKLDATTSVKAKVDNIGGFDMSLTGAISPTLNATFTTGGQISSFFNGTAKSDQTYAGLAFTFTAA